MTPAVRIVIVAALGWWFLSGANDPNESLRREVARLRAEVMTIEARVTALDSRVRALLVVCDGFRADLVVDRRPGVDL